MQRVEGRVECLVCGSRGSGYRLERRTGRTVSFDTKLYI